MKTFNILLGSLISAVLVGCAPSATQMKKLLEDNPDILYGAIQKHPDKFMEVLENAAKEARKRQQENMANQEKGQRDEEFKNPKKPKIDKARALVGKEDAPIVLVEYSDFECPFCTRGYQVVKQVKEAYGDKVLFVYKHLPLDFHPKAMPAAQYFEAIALQSADKAYKFHDSVFENQEGLRTKGEEFLKAMAKKAGADMARLAKDLKSDEVKKRIDEDMKEAREFGFQGTPGFLINGVSLRGAYPFEEFKAIIERHLGGKG